MQEFGVASLQNFWYLLKPTWMKELQNSTISHKLEYMRHVETGNNYDFCDMEIQSQQQQQVFFNTISLVFGFEIHVHNITGSTHSTTIFNRCGKSETIKIINKRKLANGKDCFEPWCIEECLVSRVKVRSLPLRCYLKQAPKSVALWVAL